MATVISGYPLGNELKFRYLIQSMIDELIRPWNENLPLTFIQNSIKDTIKVKMQCAAGDLTMQQCIKEIVRKRFSFHPSFQGENFIKKPWKSKRGILGFYRGMASPILSATPVNAFAFSVNGHKKWVWRFLKITKFLTSRGVMNSAKNLLDLTKLSFPEQWVEQLLHWLHVLVNWLNVFCRHGQNNRLLMYLRLGWFNCRK